MWRKARRPRSPHGPTRLTTLPVDQNSDPLSQESSTAPRKGFPRVNRGTTRRQTTRVAVNLLTENPSNPSGAHWFWTRMIPEMAKRLEPNEELHLLVSPRSRELYEGYGPNVHYITYPWSNEHRALRTLTEHLYSPIRLPLSRIDVFNTLMAPVISPSLLTRRPHEDHARVHVPGVHSKGGVSLSPVQLPQIRTPRRRDHHQFGEPSL